MLGIAFHTTQVDDYYLKKAYDYGASYLFTSLIYAYKTNTVDALSILVDKAHKIGYKVIIDTDLNSISKYTLKKLLALKMEGIRLDENNNALFDQMKNVSIPILYENPSQLKIQDLSITLKNNTHYIYNFYPLEFTGLQEDQVWKTNANIRLIKKDALIGAFIPGNIQYRGHEYKGLPTLEKHRNIHPYVAGCELFIKYNMDYIFIGDEKVTLYTLHGLYKLLHEKVIFLPVYAFNKENIKNIQFELRADNSNVFFRSVGKPILKAKGILKIIKELRKGTIFTFDDDMYRGTVMIARQNIILNKRACIICFIHPYFIDILDADLSLMNIHLVEGDFFEY